MAVTTVAFEPANERIKTEFVTDEAEAVLSLLAKLERRAAIGVEDWRRLFSTSGYVRLKQRELAIGRKFDDEDFKGFVLSEELRKKRHQLNDALTKWKAIDISRSGELVLTYLPKNAVIRAKIYPVIKPRDNSFVFDLENDPAIFLYLDPKKSPEDLANTIAHELHHIGFGTACPEPRTEADIKKLPENSQKALRWLGAFGEGFAMLAAAGGPDKHPHEFSSNEDKRRWDRDVANFDSDLRSVELFLLGLIDGKLSEEKEIETARSFYGIQGPWYTVGWRMAVTIEKTLGREKMIECFCDQRKLLSTFNEAVRADERKNSRKSAKWDTRLVEKLGKV